MYVLDLLKNRSHSHLDIVGIWVILPGSSLKVIVVLHLDRIVLVVIESIAADPVLAHIIEALIGCFRTAVEDIDDERHCNEKDGEHELNALTIAYHLPVAGDEVLLLHPLDIVLDIIALDGQEILIKLKCLRIWKILGIIDDDLYRNEEVGSHLRAYAARRLLFSGQYPLHLGRIDGNGSGKRDAMLLFDEGGKLPELIQCSFTHVVHNVQSIMVYEDCVKIGRKGEKTTKE